MYIYALGDFRQQVNDTVAELKEDVKSSCGKHVRRIDRFIQLAMIGSHRCVAGLTLPANECDLYLASADASKSNTVAALNQVFVEQQPIMPLNFVNLVSNAAVFYIAQSLNINGTSLFVSSENSPLEKALTLAEMDLADAPSRRALVGIVDECCTPVIAQRHLFNAGDADLLGESSIWLLTGNTKDGAIAQIHSNRTVFGITALINLIKSYLEQDAVIAASRTVNADALSALESLGCKIWHYSDNLPLQNGTSAYAVADFLSGKVDAKRLIHIDCNETGLFQLLLIESLL